MRLMAAGLVSGCRVAPKHAASTLAFDLLIGDSGPDFAEGYAVARTRYRWPASSIVSRAATGLERAVSVIALATSNAVVVALSQDNSHGEAVLAVRVQTAHSTPGFPST